MAFTGEEFCFWGIDGGSGLFGLETPTLPTALSWVVVTGSGGNGTGGRLDLGPNTTLPGARSIRGVASGSQDSFFVRAYGSGLLGGFLLSFARWMAAVFAALMSSTAPNMEEVAITETVLLLESGGELDPFCRNMDNTLNIAMQFI